MLSSLRLSSFRRYYSSLSASQLKNMLPLPSENPSIQLLDVRELEEAAGDSIPGFRHDVTYLKLNHCGADVHKLKELVITSAKLDQTKKTIVMCRSGGRSAAACQLLELVGFTNVHNLEGGIIAWNVAKNL